MEKFFMENLNQNIPPTDDPIENFWKNSTPFYDSQDVDSESDIPDEIKDIFEIHGLHKTKYNCVLKEKNYKAEGRAAGYSYITSWTNQVPSIRYIGLEYGPGEYRLLFLFLKSEGKGGKVNRYNEQIDVCVSDKFQDAHEDYILQKRMKKIEERRRQMRNAKIKNDMNDTLAGVSDTQHIDKDKRKDLKDYIGEMREVMEIMNIGNSNVPARPNIDWQGLLSIVLPLVPQILSGLSEKQKLEQENWNRVMMLLLNQSNANSNNMIELMKVQKPETTGEDKMSKMADMLFQAIDIKKAIDGQEETTSDKIFKMIEGLSGVIIPMLMLPKQQREQNPAYSAAQAYVDKAPEFQELKENPEMLVDLVTKLDNTFGWEQTDMIISNVGGYDRPTQCPRKKNKKYPAGDERNQAEETENVAGDNNE